MDVDACAESTGGTGRVLTIGIYEHDRAIADVTESSQQGAAGRAPGGGRRRHPLLHVLQSLLFEDAQAENDDHVLVLTPVPRCEVGTRNPLNVSTPLEFGDARIGGA